MRLSTVFLAIAIMAHRCHHGCHTAPLVRLTEPVLTQSEEAIGAIIATLNMLIVGLLYGLYVKANKAKSDAMSTTTQEATTTDEATTTEEVTTTEEATTTATTDEASTESSRRTWWLMPWNRQRRLKRHALVSRLLDDVAKSDKDGCLRKMVCELGDLKFGGELDPIQKLIAELLTALPASAMTSSAFSPRNGLVKAFLMGRENGTTFGCETLSKAHCSNNVFSTISYIIS